MQKVRMGGDEKKVVAQTSCHKVVTFAKGIIR